MTQFKQMGVTKVLAKQETVTNLLVTTETHVFHGGCHLASNERTAETNK